MVVAPPPDNDGGATAAKARAYRAALPAQWDERDAVHVQTFVVENASPSSVAAALWGPRSLLIRSLHAERGFWDLVEGPWEGGPAASSQDGFALAVGAKRALSFNSPSPAPSIAPGPCWQDDQQLVLVAPTQQQQQQQPEQRGPSTDACCCYVMQSDVRTGAPYGEHIAILGRTSVARAAPPASSSDDDGAAPSTVVHVAFCARYGAGLSRMVRPMITRGVDGGVRSTYAALRKGLPAALMAASREPTRPVAIRDVPPGAPLPPALRAAFESLRASGAAPSTTAATPAAAVAGGVRVAAAGGHAAAAPSPAFGPPTSLPLLGWGAFLPSASAARALAALVGDTLLFARCAVGLLSLALLSAALPAVRWLHDRAPLLMPLVHPPASTAQALTGALLLVASNRAVGALLRALEAAIAASASPGVVDASTPPSDINAAVAGPEVELSLQQERPQRGLRRRFGVHGSAFGGGGAAGAAADMAADLAAATATKLRSAADKARSSVAGAVAAQLRPRASGSGGGALLREQQHELDKEAARRLRQRQPPMLRRPDEPATAELLGGAPLTLVEDYVLPPAAGEAHALAPVDLLYERKPRRRDGAAASDRAGAAAATPASRSLSPPLPRSPPTPAPSPSGGSFGAAGSGSGRGSVKGVAWSSASLASRTKADVPGGPSPSEGGGDGPFLVLGAGACTSSPADLALLAALPDGHAPATMAAARAASAAAAVRASAVRANSVSRTSAATDNDNDNEEEADGPAVAGTAAGTVTDADVTSADHSESCVDDHGGGGRDDDDSDEDEPPHQQLFENERRQAWGWGHQYPGSFLPSDRIGHWSDRFGRPGGNASARPARVAAAQPPPGCVWAPGSRWRLDVTGREERAVDAAGWAYAVDFPQLLALPSAERCGWPPPAGSGKMTTKAFVRRRRWVRALTRVGEQQHQQPQPQQPQQPRQQQQQPQHEQPRPASSLFSPSRAASAPVGYYDSSAEEEQDEGEGGRGAGGAQRQQSGDKEGEIGAGCSVAAAAPAAAPTPCMGLIDEEEEEEHAAEPYPLPPSLPGEGRQGSPETSCADA